MIRKLFYNSCESELIKNKVEILEGDTVKILNRENLYSIECVCNSDVFTNFRTCAIYGLDNNDFFGTYPVSQLIFVNREFEDVEEILP
jgi:hypothetical protein